MVLEPLDRTAAVVLEAVVHVVHALGHVDVIAHPPCVGGVHAVKGLVRDREQGVSAEHGLEQITGVFLTVVDEVLILLDRLKRFLLSITVADLVAQTCPQAHLLCNLGNFHQRAGNFAEGGVVVEDGGDALLDGVDHQGLGTGPGGCQVQMTVDVPPLAIQYLIEVGGGVAVDGEAPGQGRVDVGVGIDEAGHNDAALGVHKFRLGVFGSQGGSLADLHNPSAVSDHAAVGQVAGACGISGDEPAVCQ